MSILLRFSKILRASLHEFVFNMAYILCFEALWKSKAIHYCVSTVLCLNINMCVRFIATILFLLEKGLSDRSYVIIKTVFKLFSYNYQSHMCSTLKTYVNSKHAVKKREDAILTRPVFASILTEKCPNGNIREQRTKPRGQSGTHRTPYRGTSPRAKPTPVSTRKSSSQ